MAERIKIQPPFIKLDALLKFAGLVQSGGEAKAFILEGLVTVNGETCLQRGQKIKPGDRVTVGPDELEVSE